jgi:tripartite-type tricarboxylate transporter receptor subunit TctC
MNLRLFLSALPRHAALVGATLTLSMPLALAQAPTWPEKVVRIVAAGPSGGSADIVARLLADELSKQIGQTVIVEPKPGAGGLIADNDLSMAPRDGHTLLVGVNSLVSEIPHIVKQAANMAAQIKPLVEVSRGGLVMVGNVSLPAKTLPELIAYAKANPDKVNFASYTAGTISHVMGLQLNNAAGIDMMHVGYKGSTPALQDLMGGHVQLMFDGMATSIPLIKGGKIKAFAVSTPSRTPLLPDVPTFAELGYPQLEAVAWMGLWVRPDLPAPLQVQIREAALKALAQPAVRTRLQ